MKQRENTISDQIVQNQHVTLLELLDRLLDKGVMVKGEILLSVADIDLVYLNLGLLLSSVKTFEEAAKKGGNEDAKLIAWQAAPQEESLGESVLDNRGIHASPTSFTREHNQHARSNGELTAGTLPSTIDDGLNQLFSPKTNIDPKNVEKGLAKLILTLVDLIRKLMEKQVIRRIDSGQLNSYEIEKVGNTLFLLDERMEQIKKTFGLNDEDLHLDLGPLGELL